MKQPVVINIHYRIGRLPAQAGQRLCMQTSQLCYMAYKSGTGIATVVKANRQGRLRVFRFPQIRLGYANKGLPGGNRV